MTLLKSKSLQRTKYTYDRDADAIYICLSAKPYSYTSELDDSRNINYAADNTPIGVELLYVSQGVNIWGLPNGEVVDSVIEALEIEEIVELVD